MAKDTHKRFIAQLQEQVTKEYAEFNDMLLALPSATQLIDRAEEIAFKTQMTGIILGVGVEAEATTLLCDVVDYDNPAVPPDYLEFLYTKMLDVFDGTIFDAELLQEHLEDVTLEELLIQERFTKPPHRRFL